MTSVDWRPHFHSSQPDYALKNFDFMMVTNSSAQCCHNGVAKIVFQRPLAGNREYMCNFKTMEIHAVSFYKQQGEVPWFKNYNMKSSS